MQLVKKKYHKYITESKAITNYSDNQGCSGNHLGYISHFRGKHSLNIYLFGHGGSLYSQLNVKQVSLFNLNY